MTDPLAIIMDLPLVSTIADDITLGKQYRAVFAVHGKAIEAVQVEIRRAKQDKVDEALGVTDPDAAQKAADRIAATWTDFQAATMTGAHEHRLVVSMKDGLAREIAELDLESTSIRVVVPERVLVG